MYVLLGCAYLLTYSTAWPLYSANVIHDALCGLLLEGEAVCAGNRKEAYTSHEFLANCTCFSEVNSVGLLRTVRTVNDDLGILS